MISMLYLFYRQTIKLMIDPKHAPTSKPTPTPTNKSQFVQSCFIPGVFCSLFHANFS